MKMMVSLRVPAREHGLAGMQSARSALCIPGVALAVPALADAALSFPARPRSSNRIAYVRAFGMHNLSTQTEVFEVIHINDKVRQRMQPELRPSRCHLTLLLRCSSSGRVHAMRPSSTAAPARRARARPPAPRLVPRRSHAHTCARLFTCTHVHTLTCTRAHARMHAHTHGRARTLARTQDPGSGWTALHFACLRGNVQIVKELLKFDADVMALDSPYCQTPLHISAKYAHAEVSRIFYCSGTHTHKHTHTGVAHC